MKYPESTYLQAELFDDGDAEIRCMTKKIITTRKEHRCAMGDVLQKPHQITPQSEALKESAIVEGEWVTAYSCLPCIDQWLSELAEMEYGG